MLTVKETKELRALDKKIMGGKKVTRNQVMRAIELIRKRDHKPGELP